LVNDQIGLPTLEICRRFNEDKSGRLEILLYPVEALTWD
jgi:hypothetical protein